MAWSTSAVFKEFIKNPGTRAINAATAPTTYTDLLTDTVKVALYNNTGTPDKDAAVGLTGYNAASSAWVAANEKTDPNWAAGGRVLATDTYTAGVNTMTYDAADLAGGGTLTLTDVHGCLVYDDTITGGTVADQGVCFNWFGGAQSVTSGTFTIIWHANGIFQITV